MTDTIASTVRWVPHVFAIELKKAFSYRVAFWVQFLLGTIADLSIAYFLWKAVFEARAVSTLNGFTLEGLVYYYLFATFSAKIVRGTDRGYLSDEIYDGSLTRYLLYPLPILGFKYVTHMTQQLLGVIQLLLAWCVLRAFLPLPVNSHLTLASFCAGLVTCVLAGYLSFMIGACIEMVAFWQDVIWNLMAMLRFTMAFLGGSMIPLAFFPEWGLRVIRWTPFPVLISFPARTFLGEISAGEWFANVGILALWSLAVTVLVTWIWARGTRRYTGVGI